MTIGAELLTSRINRPRRPLPSASLRGGELKLPRLLGGEAVACVGASQCEGSSFLDPNCSSVDTDDDSDGPDDSNAPDPADDPDAIDDPGAGCHVPGDSAWGWLALCWLGLAWSPRTTPSRRLALTPRSCTRGQCTYMTPLRTAQGLRSPAPRPYLDARSEARRRAEAAAHASHHRRSGRQRWAIPPRRSGPESGGRGR